MCVCVYLCLICTLCVSVRIPTSHCFNYSIFFYYVLYLVGLILNHFKDVSPFLTDLFLQIYGRIKILDTFLRSVDFSLYPLHFTLIICKYFLVFFSIEKRVFKEGSTCLLLWVFPFISSLKRGCQFPLCFLPY